MDTIFGLDVAPIALQILLFTAFYAFLYRRHFLSLFDPLNMLIAGAVGGSILIVNTVSDHFWWVQFFASQLAFFIGFSCNRLPKDFKNRSLETNGPWIRVDAIHLAVLEVTVLLLFVMSVAGNFYLGATAGFPIFSREVGEGAKVSMFVGGLGWVKRLNDSMSTFLPCGALVLYALGRRKNFWLSLVFIEAIFVSLSGSKSSMLLVLFAITYLTYHKAFRAEPRIERLKGWIKPITFLTVGWAIVVLSIEGGQGMANAVFNFAVRLVAYGDVVLYYYRPEIIHAFSSFSALAYPGYVLNPILGEFRLAPYQYPLGYQMVVAQVGQGLLPTIVGPNTWFYVAGNIFFGPFGSLLYSAVLGYVVSYVRRLFFCRRQLGVIAFAFLFTATMLVFALPIDAQYFVSMVFDTLVLAGAALSISYLAIYAASPNFAKVSVSEAHSRSTEG